MLALCADQAGTDLYWQRIAEYKRQRGFSECPCTVVVSSCFNCLIVGINVLRHMCLSDRSCVVPKYIDLAPGARREWKEVGASSGNSVGLDGVGRRLHMVAVRPQ